MRQYGGLGSPIMFAIWGLGMPVALMMCLLIPFAILVAVGAGNEGGAGMGLGIGVGMIAAFAVALIFYVIVAATLGALLAAAIYHVCLLMVGGARQGFETTFRVVSFVQGSPGRRPADLFPSRWTGTGWMIALIIGPPRLTKYRQQGGPGHCSLWRDDALHGPGRAVGSQRLPGTDAVAASCGWPAFETLPKQPQVQLLVVEAARHATSRTRGPARPSSPPSASGSGGLTSRSGPQ
jgi:hypothetical protein